MYDVVRVIKALALLSSNTGVSHRAFLGENFRMVPLPCLFTFNRYRYSVITMEPPDGWPGGRPVITRL